jgi:hypothetical protein
VEMWAPFLTKRLLVNFTADVIHPPSAWPASKRGGRGEGVEEGDEAPFLPV